MTGTVERSLGVGAVSINMTVMGVVIVMYRESLRLTLVDIYKKKNEEFINANNIVPIIYYI